MNRLLICVLILSVLFVSSCGVVSTSVPAKNKIPDLEGQWTITMIHSGGIMGLSRSITISSDGKFSLTDARTGQTKEGMLSNDELNQLARLAADTQYSPSTDPSGCADCFIYDIEISGTDKPFAAHADDVTLDSSGLGPLVMELRTIMDRESR